MYNYKIKIQYDGGRYEGWQRIGKDFSANTVENKIITVIEKMAGEKIELPCGCRTETGVHALEQVANFKLSQKREKTDIRNYLNRYLPRDIAVLSVEQVDERFHSQLNAKSKTYMYVLDMGNVADVFKRKYSYHTFHRLNIEAMQKASHFFVGEHDFKAFTTAKKNKSTVRNVEAININVQGNQAVIEMTANDFMHNMARYIIGMLLDVGNEIRKPEIVNDVFANKEVTMSFPAESYGLFLKNIMY